MSNAGTKNKSRKADAPSPASEPGNGAGGALKKLVRRPRINHAVPAQSSSIKIYNPLYRQIALEIIEGKMAQPPVMETIETIINKALAERYGLNIEDVLTGKMNEPV